MTVPLLIRKKSGHAAKEKSFIRAKFAIIASRLNASIY